VRDVRTGRVNRHWRVTAGGREYVLRRYTAHRSRAAIAFEHALLAHAAARGWPVAVPVLAAGDATVGEYAGGRYALFPALAGRPGRYGSRAREKGRLLARLHRDLASWPAWRQRDGLGRLSELDAHAPGTLDANLRAFERAHRDLARAVWRERAANVRELDRLGYDALPLMPIHGDFHRDNLLFTRGALSGLLDFDLARLDARAADIGITLASDCRVPPAYNDIDVEAARVFLVGYDAESQLGEDERRLIVPLAKAYLLWLIAFRLGEWSEGHDARVVRAIERSVGARLPAVEASRREIEAALRAT
jgi:homoserine kinase type II